MYKERDEKKRKVFLEQIASFPLESIVYVDESGIDSYVSNSYGWSLRGSPVYGEVSGKRYARESFIAGLCGKKLLAPMCYKGTCNTQLFNTWVEKCLVPELKPGQVVVLDNASFHKSENTKKLIENAGCKIIFLPPYSPDLNPIETFWANLKDKIKKIVQEFKSLQNAVDHAFKMYDTKLT